MNLTTPCGTPSKIALLSVMSAALLMTSCGRDEEKRGTERWVTTEKTNVKIDWDKINEAYKKAEGPAEFEEKVNEIYEGKEIISIAVEDTEERAQTVVGFFDNNNNGTVEEDEKIFSIQRDITGEGEGQYQISGHGAHYGYYHSPMMSIVSGMLMGSMMASMFRPSYAPARYTTSTARRGQLKSTRSSYRAKNPSKFSKSGRKYNSKGTRSWGSSGRSSGRSRGGGSFGIHGRRKRKEKPVRLSA